MEQCNQKWNFTRNEILELTNLYGSWIESKNNFSKWISALNQELQKKIISILQWKYLFTWESKSNKIDWITMNMYYNDFVWVLIEQDLEIIKRLAPEYYGKEHKYKTKYLKINKDNWQAIFYNYYDYFFIEEVMEQLQDWIVRTLLETFNKEYYINNNAIEFAYEDRFRQEGYTPDRVLSLKPGKTVLF